MPIDQIAQKRSQCLEQSEALTEMMNVIDKMVNVLGEKLLPIRCNRPQVKGEAVDKPIEPSVAPLAQYIKERGQHARKIMAMLETILNEVEC